MSLEAGLPLDAGLCLLRPWRDGDQQPLVAAANYREIWRGLRDRFPSPYTMAEADAWIALVRAGPEPIQLALEVEGTIAGGIGLIPQADVHRLSAEVGYWLTPSRWGAGIATAALRRFTRWVFETRDLERLFAVTFASNPASARVLEKADYRLEGVLRRSVLKDGQVMDSLLYARLRS